MKLRFVLFVLAIGMPAMHCWSSTCDAQWRRLSQPSQKPLRLMGHGWSSGYHWKNPGHDSSYYNPYSHHNSSAQSRWNPGAMYSAGYSAGTSTGYSAGDVHAEPTPVSPSVSGIDADIRSSTPKETANSTSSKEPVKSPKVDPLEIEKKTEKKSKPSNSRPARGENKSEIEKELPFDIN